MYVPGPEFIKPLGYVPRLGGLLGADLDDQVRSRSPHRDGDAAGGVRRGAGREGMPVLSGPNSCPSRLTGEL